VPGVRINTEALNAKTVFTIYGNDGRTESSNGRPAVLKEVL